jgi:hypothetical protein
MSPYDPGDITIVRRQGIVQAVNLGSFPGQPGNYPITVDVQLGGSTVTIPGMRFLQSYVPYVYDSVWVDLKGGDPLVIGSVNGGHYWYVPAFANGWSDYGGIYSCKYCREVNNTVRICGLVKSGTIGQACIIMPVGFRPVRRFITAAVDGGGGFGRLDVNEDGTVIPYVGSNAWYGINVNYPLD